MNIHTRLVGAFDAIILSLTAALTLVVLFVLFNPSADRGHLVQTKDQAINATTAAAASRA